MVPLVAREEAANSRNEGYEGKVSKSIINGGRSSVFLKKKHVLFFLKKTCFFFEKKHC